MTFLCDDCLIKTICKEICTNLSENIDSIESIEYLDNQTCPDCGSTINRPSGKCTKCNHSFFKDEKGWHRNYINFDTTNNVYIGYQAGYDRATGFSNIAIGYKAGYKI